MNAKFPDYHDSSGRTDLRVIDALDALSRIAEKQAEQVDKLISICDELSSELVVLRTRVAILERHTFGVSP